MTQLLEDHFPLVKYEGLNTNKAVVFGSTLAVTGAVTLSAALTVAGITNTGAVVGNRMNVVRGTTATYALTTALSGTVYVGTATSGTQTYTLPAVATAGVYFTFICGHASGEILVTPQASEAIVMTSFAAVGVDADTGIVAPAAGTGVKNTAATNAIGDSLTLVSDGVQWNSVGITSGIWASQ